MIKNITPIGQRSAVIFKQREYALIAISPFNSYFSVERITLLIQYAKHNFNDFALCLTDGISRFTLEGLGYSAKEAQRKVRNSDALINKKAAKALANAGYSETEASKKIIKISSLLTNPNYMKFYTLYKEKFTQDKAFRAGCLEVSQVVINSAKGAANKTPIDDSTANTTAVQYFLHELPLFLNMSEILGTSSCLYVYHAIPDFLRSLYADTSSIADISSKTQGFLIVETALADNNIQAALPAKSLPEGPAEQKNS